MGILPVVCKIIRSGYDPENADSNHKRHEQIGALCRRAGIGEKDRKTDVKSPPTAAVHSPPTLIKPG